MALYRCMCCDVVEDVAKSYPLPNVVPEDEKFLRVCRGCHAYISQKQKEKKPAKLEVTSRYGQKEEKKPIKNGRQR